MEYLPTGQGLPILILQEATPVQLVFVQSQIVAPGRQHVEEPFMEVVRHSNVCGRVRGYQYREPEAFHTGRDSIDSHYLHGVSITCGTPRTHLCIYGAGETEQLIMMCILLL